MSELAGHPAPPLAPGLLQGYPPPGSGLKADRELALEVDKLVAIRGERERGNVCACLACCQRVARRRARQAGLPPGWPK